MYKINNNPLMVVAIWGSISALTSMFHIIFFKKFLKCVVPVYRTQSKKYFKHFDS